MVSRPSACLNLKETPTKPKQTDSVDSYPGCKKRKAGLLNPSKRLSYHPYASSFNI